MEGPARPPISQPNAEGPAPPPQRRRVMGPALGDDEPPASEASQKRRVMGPSLGDEPPIVEGPAPPGPQKRRVMGPALDDDEPPIAEGPAPPVGPQKRRVMGPTLDDDEPPVSEGPAPPGPQKRRVMGPTLDDDEPPVAEGPAPPGPQKRRVMGPTLDDDEAPITEGPARPPGMEKPEAPAQGKKRELERGPMVGPVIGPPRPSEGQAYPEEDEEEIERRMRANEWETVKKVNATKVIQREEWMTELPPERSANPVALITNRQFSRKDNATSRGDTSAWTDSPADRERKKQKMQDSKNLKEVVTQQFASQKDETNAKIIEQYNKKYRAKSLAEEHQEILKKKQAEAKPEDEPIWKPFDRTTDLEMNASNPATTAKLIKNAQNLNTRFGSASNKRFL